MRFHLVFIIIVGLLGMGGICSAAYIPDSSSTITNSTNWVIVAHQSTITIVANNATGGTVPNATVSLSLNSTTWGTLSTVSGTTDATGTLTSTFTAGTKPGTANITAIITYIDNGTPYIIQKSCLQNIDHDAAYTALYTYPIQATVASETLFNVSYTDKYGNPIDNRNTADPHYVTLSIGSTNNLARFDLNGTYVQSTTELLDANGNFTVTVLTDDTAS